MYNKNFQIGNFEFNIDDILKTAWEAGRAIMDIYKKDFEIEFKQDESPLTIADKIAHEIIQKNL
jgi:3'(2'), 5'-bisphosphate nucleotidase